MKLQLISTVSEKILGGQTETIEIYEADITRDRPITKTFIQVVTYSEVTKFSRLTAYTNYGFSSHDRQPHFNSQRRFKNKTQAYKAAKIHLLGS